MKSMQWIIFITGIAALVVHGFFPAVFTLDWFSVLILFILSIPFLAPYLKKAKVSGAEFEFRDEIRETRMLVQSSAEKAKNSDHNLQQENVQLFETFKLTSVRELVNDDPTLALAALRIEIERRLRNLISTLSKEDISKFTTFSLTDLIKKVRLLSREQLSALQKILRMCNEAIHGASVSKSQANEIITLAEELNHSFSVGYSIDLSPNNEYKENGFLCEFEHCIELMPLSKNRTKLSCPVFGHDCPGGAMKVNICDKTISDIPVNRFSNNDKI